MPTAVRQTFVENGTAVSPIIAVIPLGAGMAVPATGVFIPIDQFSVNSPPAPTVILQDAYRVNGLEVVGVAAARRTHD